MKKGTKGMLIAAGAFAVAGIGFCIGGISVAAVETGGNRPTESGTGNCRGRRTGSQYGCRYF